MSAARLISRDGGYARRGVDDEGNGNWEAWREPGGFTAFGSAGRSGGWFGGWRRDDRPAWQGQRRGFWSW